MSGVYDHASEDNWKAKHDPDRQDSPFVTTPPSKPGWYWCQIEAFPYPIVYPVQAIVDDDTKCICDSAGEPLLETVGIQWDPTPIPGPGELQKVVKRSYEEGWMVDRTSKDEETTGPLRKQFEQDWEASATRSKYHVPESQATITAEDRR